jgi:hypothetical protein
MNTRLYRAKMEIKDRSTHLQHFSKVAQKKVARCTSCELRTILSTKEVPEKLQPFFAQLLSGWGKA